ncbi:glycosyltransferase family 2 protein [Massilia sp. DWR3-1-1]|uniref:glycosyltransferase family 2 protein n=1 Tax=Massilia sp. DWR3-1-1 TaxID=2804559 RepID=UPI003CE69D90
MVTMCAQRPHGGANPAAIAVIMPVYNGSAFLARSLAPLTAMLARGEVAELIVVDDGSTDDSMLLARAAGATVMTSGGRLGPGAARNVGARAAGAAILWFVDADVVVHAQAAERIGAVFGGAGGAPLAALFGSYDDEPAAPGFFSQYKNLAHHHQHQRSGGASSSFWAGCGAVRSAAFAAVGGFDGARYPQPSIEDIDMGARMAALGMPVVLDPAILCTHLKVWRLKELLATDILRRALPWSRLILARGTLRDELNVRHSERWRALLAALFLSALAAPLLAPPLPALLCAALLGGAAIGANHRLFSLFRRRHGSRFALLAMAFHQLVYVYSGAVFAFCWVEWRLGRRPR